MAVKLLSRMFGRRREDGRAETVYAAIVAAARRPEHYSDRDVPDTVPGRLEMIILHLVMLFHRLAGEGERGATLGQAVFDAFAIDMDRSLREMGVGDLGVPKRMKAIGRSFYGRLSVYGGALDRGDAAGLAVALQRNLFPEDAGGAPLAGLAAYAMAMDRALAARDVAAIEAGVLWATEAPVAA